MSDIRGFSYFLGEEEKWLLMLVTCSSCIVQIREFTVLTRCSEMDKWNDEWCRKRILFNHPNSSSYITRTDQTLARAWGAPVHCLLFWSRIVSVALVKYPPERPENFIRLLDHSQFADHFVGNVFWISFFFFRRWECVVFSYYSFLIVSWREFYHAVQFRKRPVL